jgi:hypothetical protein
MPKQGDERGRALLILVQEKWGGRGFGQREARGARGAIWRAQRGGGASRASDGDVTCMGVLATEPIDN